MAPPSDDYYLNISDCPLALTVLTANGVQSSKLVNGADAHFFSYLEQDPRSKDCIVSEISILKESHENKLEHELLVVGVAGPDGNTKYEFIFERTGGESSEEARLASANSAQVGNATTPPNESAKSSKPTVVNSSRSSDSLNLITFKTRRAKHEVTVYPYNMHTTVFAARPPATEVYKRTYGTQSQGATVSSYPSTASSSSDNQGGEQPALQMFPASSFGAAPADVHIEDALTLQEFASLALCVMGERKYYNLFVGSCYWLAAAVILAVDKALGRDVTQIVSNRAGRCSLCPVPTSNVTNVHLDAILVAYNIRQSAAPIPREDTTRMRALLDEVRGAYDTAFDLQGAKKQMAENRELLAGMAEKDELLARKEDELRVARQEADALREQMNMVLDRLALVEGKVSGKAEVD